MAIFQWRNLAPSLGIVDTNIYIKNNVNTRCWESCFWYIPKIRPANANCLPSGLHATVPKMLDSESALVTAPFNVLTALGTPSEWFKSQIRTSPSQSEDSYHPRISSHSLAMKPCYIIPNNHPLANGLRTWQSFYGHTKRQPWWYPGSRSSEWHLHYYTIYMSPFAHFLPIQSYYLLWSHCNLGTIGTVRETSYRHCASCQIFIKGVGIVAIMDHGTIFTSTDKAFFLYALINIHYLYMGYQPYVRCK